MTVMPHHAMRPPMGPPRAQPPKSHHHGPSGAAVGVGSTTHSGAENAGSEGEMELVDRSWETYFREQIHLELPSRNLRSCVYVAGPPLAPNCPNQTAVVLLHGGGHTSMSWALVASALGGCGWPVLAIDFRAHGETTLLAEEEGLLGGEEDMSAENLVADILCTLDAFLEQMGDSLVREGVRLAVAGHSLGGAIAVRVASAITGGESQQFPPASLGALVVLDVVEGTALSALPHMPQIVASKPKRFSSLKRAISWAVRSSEVRNRESACVSIPSQLRQDPITGKWVWRADVLRTEEHWKGWFTGLSSLFLGARCPKLLLLAGTDRLDRDLTIAQMQGKFQMNVVYGTGHILQEDSPDRTTEILDSFFHHHQLNQPESPPSSPSPSSPS